MSLMTTDSTIRMATSTDAVRLSELAARTFSDAFAADNRPEDMAVYLAASFTVERQAAELADPEVTTLLAEIGSELAGYAQLRSGPAPEEVTDPAAHELVRFYVDRHHHGRGVAQSLMAAVLAAARERGARTLWLGVWERNLRAIAFYGKSGFVDVGSHEFWLGSDRQTDRLMARPIGEP
jgi:ribosomal protein S18 acetylase RimI-like enzyme